MGLPPIPKRIPPLSWRQPTTVWTPAAVALGLGWSALVLRSSNALVLTVLIAGAIVFAGAFVTMAGAWITGQPPRTRREVIQYFLAAGLIVSICAPFVLNAVLDSVAEAEHTSTGLRAATPFALMPLAVLLGLPIAFFYGLVFSIVALIKPSHDGPAQRRSRPKKRVIELDDVPFA